MVGHDKLDPLAPHIEIFRLSLCCFPAGINNHSSIRSASVVRVSMGSNHGYSAQVCFNIAFSPARLSVTCYHQNRIIIMVTGFGGYCYRGLVSLFAGL